MKRDPYPLAWPDGWARSQYRLTSKFGKGVLGLASARHGLLLELRRLGASNVVITSDLPTRRDGLPYADGRTTDPGVAAWFVLRDQERVFACDKWRTHAENMRAIALSIEAMRGLERWGMADVVARAFAGFNALPPGDAPAPAPKKRTWREVFAVDGLQDIFSAAEVLAIVKTRHREAIKLNHPDAGGSHELAAELNAALTEAEIELA